MATTVWKGHLTFGLVSMPVRLIRAARPERVKLRQLYRPRTTSPPEEEESIETLPAQIARPPEVRMEAPKEMRASVVPPAPAEQVHVAPVRRVFEALGEDAPVASADLVKGYEYEKGQYVVLEQEDLRALAAQTSTEIQVVEFVRFAEIDPVYFETSYYVLPDDDAEKAYALLLEAMRQTGYAAMGQLTMHRRDHVIILRPGKRGLIGHTMFYPDEVRATEEFRTDTSLVAEKELRLAKALVLALAQTFEPARFKNAFRERLGELIAGRIAGSQVAQVETRAPAKVIDIMDALKRSLTQAKEMSSATSATQARRKPAAAVKSSSSGGKNKKTR